MKTALVIISTLLTVLAVVPYILDILKRKTKPRLVSWFTWTLLTTISAAASFSDQQWPAGVLSTAASIECLTIVILGFKYGDRELTPFDIGCQIGAIVGLILWWIFNSPAIAVIAAVLIDALASLPTYKHAWVKPFEETWQTFALSGIGPILTLAAASEIKVTSAANPIYLILVNFFLAGLIVARRHSKFLTT
jgi:hypothetical protein